jgi:hypothetical protein
VRLLLRHTVVWLTAATLLAAGLPHSVCACPQPRPQPAGKGLPLTTACCCCRQAEAAPPDEDSEESPPCCCCCQKSGESAPASEGEGKKEEPRGPKAERLPCATALALAESFTPPAKGPGVDRVPTAACCLPGAFTIPPACACPAALDRGPAPPPTPPTDRLALMQHFQI